MKANEAPEKIYLNPIQDVLADILSKKVDGDIEYTRTDAFIDKAWEWVENNVLSINQQDKSRLYYEQFVNYMEGE